MTDPFIPGKSPLPEGEAPVPERLKFYHKPPPPKNWRVRAILMLVIGGLLVAAFTVSVLRTANDVTGASNPDTEVR